MDKWIIRDKSTEGKDWPKWAIRIECTYCCLVTGSKSNYCPQCGKELIRREPS